MRSINIIPIAVKDPGDSNYYTAKIALFFLAQHYDEVWAAFSLTFAVHSSHEPL